MAIRAVVLLLVFLSGGAAAALPMRYMQTTEDATVWARIGNKTMTVGNLRAGQIIAIEPDVAHARIDADRLAARNLIDTLGQAAAARAVE